MAKFHCIHCGQRIDAPDKLAGTNTNCPTCGGAIAVPPLSATPPPLPVRQPPSANSGSHNPTWPETFQAAGKEFTRMVEKAALETDGFKQVHADVFGVLVYSSVNFIKLVVAQKPEEQLQYHVVIENIKKERVITLLMGLCKGFLETSIVKMPSLKAQLNPLLHLFDFELCLTHTDQTPTSYVGTSPEDLVMYLNAHLNHCFKNPSDPPADEFGSHIFTQEMRIQSACKLFLEMCDTITIPDTLEAMKH